jgi:hypothetical protein
MPGIHLLSLLFTVVVILWTAGPLLGAILIGAGIGLRLAMRSTGCPKTVASLLFLGPVLMR